MLLLLLAFWEHLQFCLGLSVPFGSHLASHCLETRVRTCSYHLQVMAKSAIVHILMDGGVLVVHPGCDMGQGLVTKVLQTAAYELSKVRV